MTLRLEEDKYRYLEYWAYKEFSNVPQYLPTGGIESVVICYCHYSPVVTPLELLPRLQFVQELQQV